MSPNPLKIAQYRKEHNCSLMEAKRACEVLRLKRKIRDLDLDFKPEVLKDILMEMLNIIKGE